MEKAEIFSFPTVIGSRGRRQSLHNKILIGAKPFKLSLPYFSPDVWEKICDFCPQIVVQVEKLFGPQFWSIYTQLAFVGVR